MALFFTSSVKIAEVVKKDCHGEIGGLNFKLTAIEFKKFGERS
jgi:hypothetical protein